MSQGHPLNEVFLVSRNNKLKFDKQSIAVSASALEISNRLYLTTSKTSVICERYGESSFNRDDTRTSNSLAVSEIPLILDLNSRISQIFL